MNKIIPAEIPQSELTNSTDKKEFKPTPTMRVWVDTAVALVSDSPKEISDESGLDRTNWYKWKNVEGFEDWYYAEYKRLRTRWIPKLDRIGMKKAEEQYNYWEAMNKKAGEDVSQSTNQVNIQNNMSIEFE